MNAGNAITRIGMFFDGQFYSHVSNHFAFVHPLRARISIQGLMEFVRRRVAALEGIDPRFCQMVDMRYFRGRVAAAVADDRDLLLTERRFDDVLMRAGITTHYLPVGPSGEKGVDVWLALEAFEGAILKRFDLIVLVAGDGDFVPLVRKLNAIGTRVMLLGCRSRHLDPETNELREIGTSERLIASVSYPLLLNEIIDAWHLRGEGDLDGLFMAASNPTSAADAASFDGDSAVEAEQAEAPGLAPLGSRIAGTIKTLQQGYGFVEAPGLGTLFFSAKELPRSETVWMLGDEVSFEIGLSPRPEHAGKRVAIRLQRAGRTRTV